MKAHDRALATLEAATAKYRELENARLEVEAAIVAALKAGAPPTEVVKRAPFSATYVRTIARNHKIPPAPPGVKPAKKAAPAKTQRRGKAGGSA